MAHLSGVLDAYDSMASEKTNLDLFPLESWEKSTLPCMVFESKGFFFHTPFLPSPPPPPPAPLGSLSSFTLFFFYDRWSTPQKAAAIQLQLQMYLLRGDASGNTRWPGCGILHLYVGHKCRILYAFSVSLLRHFDRMFKWLRIGDGMHVISTSKSPQDCKSQHSCAALSLIERDDFVQTCSAQLAFSCASIKMDVWVDALWISIINSFKWTILLILVF